MSFASDKVDAMEVLQAFSCQQTSFVDFILTDYDKVFAAYLSLHEYFDCYPTFIYAFMDCWDGAALLANDIYYNQTSGTLTDPKLIVRGTATTVNISTTTQIPEFAVSGDAVVDEVNLTGTGYIGMFSVQAGATIKVISTDATSYIDVLRIVGCNGIGATVNAAATGTRILNVDVNEGAFFGGINCVDPTDVCGDEVSGLAFSNVSNTGLTLKWTAAPTSIRTIVSFRTNNAPTWLYPNSTDPDNHVTGNYIEGVPGYAFRGLQPSTFYDFRVVNVCPNGVLSAGAIATQSTTGSGGSGGGSGPIMIDDHVEFFATDGQTTYVNAQMINAPLVAVYIDGARRYSGAGAEDIEFDNTTGTITFNTPLVGPPTSTPGQRVIIDVYR